MELTKNIFFNTDKLIENSTVKISYTGKFFQDASEEVFLHCGFGINWDNVNEIKMEKTELGFQVKHLIYALKMEMTNGIIMKAKTMYFQ